MARLLADPAQYLRRSLGKKSRVLLINPPVQEQRYHWLRWNQPLELLRLSSWLKATHPGIDVRLFDFMLADESGAVPRHKVKETWTGSAEDTQLWHFGQPFEELERYLGAAARRTSWTPDVVIISSLTSYWHVSIEKLLTRLCTTLGQAKREAATFCLYGNYPRLEPEHAAAQPDADVAFRRTVETRGFAPDFRLYLDNHDCAPAFFALDVEDPGVDQHLTACLELQAEANRRRGVTRPPAVTVAFFNDDVCSNVSQLAKVAAFVQGRPKQVVVEGICGIEPESLTSETLAQLKLAGFRSLFVEHARLPGGGVDVGKYGPLLEFLREEEHSKKSGRSASSWIERGNVTGFVGMGLPDDNMDDLVRSTLQLNSFFHAVILKPFGYSPRIDAASPAERRRRWPQPSASSPQWYPYVGHGSRLGLDDYENLVRWQNVLNKRVKGTTFDFLDQSAVAKLVRETVVAESWKPRQEAR